MPKNVNFFKTDKISWSIIDSQGRRPDPQRTEAIEKMPAPYNVPQLQSFGGLAQYYAIYIPKIHKLRALLNELLKKDKSGFGQKSAKVHLKRLRNPCYQI